MTTPPALPTPRPALAGLLLAALLLPGARAQEPAAAPPPAAPKVVPAQEGNRNDIASQLREAMSSGDPRTKKLNLIIDRQSSSGRITEPSAPPPVNPVDHPGAKAVADQAAREPGLVIRTRPAAPKIPPRPVAWSYHGEGGPAHWGRLKDDYATCARGQRQSPVAIEADQTLKGPAEPITFNYQPSKGTVTNTGHTVQVDVEGHNTLAVRGTTYLLQQFHFHHPAEERIAQQDYPMVAHLVHRDDLGRLAVLAVLLEPGEANALIDKVWTHMPLDVGDSVRLPPDLLDLGALLPKDRRYYQYLGSLTTPPCTEGVLWLILKQPVSLSAAQLQLFGQLYPHNARPLQPLNGRPVREAVELAPAAAP